MRSITVVSVELQVIYYIKDTTVKSSLLKRIGITGSYARGDFTERSDLTENKPMAVVLPLACSSFKALWFYSPL